MKIQWSPQRMTSGDLAVRLKQIQTEICQFSKVNFLRVEEDILVLQTAASCCISFPALKGIS